MGIRNVLTRRTLAGFGISALAAAVLAGVPTAAHALPNFKIGQVDFGTVAVGSSVERPLTITNRGNAAVPEDTAFSFVAQVIGDPTDPQFTIVEPTCSAPGDLAGGQSCNDITVKFTPTSSAPTTATVELTYIYEQDIDPDPNNQDIRFVQRLTTATLLGNVSCGGLAPTIFGTDGDDTISGTAGNDVIAALGGEDVVVGLGGNDIVCGGFGNDTLKGGAGKDKLYGESGADVLKGGKGTDRCIGGLGIDRAKKCEKVGSL